MLSSICFIGCKQECTVCGGDGKCWYCHGDGKIGTSTVNVTCTACKGDGNCPNCNGDGKVKKKDNENFKTQK